MIHSAQILPAPPPWTMPKVKTQASKAFGTPGIGPISGLPSGAYGIGPLTTRVIPAVPRIGTRAQASAT
jgi:hypothetical protein